MIRKLFPLHIRTSSFANCWGGLHSTKKEMALTNDENLKYDSDPSKSPKSQRENVLHTIMSSASNRRIARSINQGDSSSSLGRKLSLGSEKQIISIADNRSHYESLFELHSDDSDDSEFEDLDEVDRMLPGLLERGIAYTIKETIFHGYIDKKGSGFDWIGSRAWKTRWAVLVVRLKCCFHEYDDIEQHSVTLRSLF